jgi:polyprenyl-phospho-N-acetylgalactosaminyl synthase
MQITIYKTSYPWQNLKGIVIFLQNMPTPMPQAVKQNIVVVMPAYNENGMVRNTAESLLQQGHTLIIVDDGSDTPVIHFVNDLPVIVLRHKINLGQGAALQTGFSHAKKLNADILVTFDADGQHDVQDIAALVAPIVRQEADIVLGSRFLPGSGADLSFSKKMVLQLARLINFLLSGALLSDAHNGFRALSRQALQKIELTENGMAHASEILFETRRHKLRYCEVPVHIRYTDYSKHKGQSAWDSIKILFDLVLHKLFK